MRKLFESIKTKSGIVKLIGALLIALGFGAYYLGDSIQDDAEKGLLILDQGKLDETILK